MSPSATSAIVTSTSRSCRKRQAWKRPWLPYDSIIARSAELGGVYSGEHGTGKRKRKDFLRCYGAAAADDVIRCKRAVDPFFLLNHDNGVECPREVPA